MPEVTGSVINTSVVVPALHPVLFIWLKKLEKVITSKTKTNRNAHAGVSRA